MVMKLNTGVPGAGKTYLMIKSFVDLFCSYDKDTGLYDLKEDCKDIILISNIQGLRLEHLDIESLMMERCLQLARTKYVDNIGEHKIEDMEDVIDEYYYQFLAEKVRWFFNKDYQEAMKEKHGSIVYLIEESQRYFDSKELGRQKWVRDVFHFFEVHRHLGFSIFCDTQHISKLAKGVTVLFESETRAKPRTLSLMGEFKYDEYVEGVKTNSIPIVVKPNKKIFETYTSMTEKEDVKTKNPAMKIVIFVCIMCVFAFGILTYVKSHFGGKSLPQTVIKNQSSSPGGRIEKKKISPPGHWEHLAHVLKESGVVVIHPITFAVIPLKEFDLKVKRQGTELYCFIEDSISSPSPTLLQ